MVQAFLISAPRSGEGKTLLTLGFLRLFKKRGLKVQPFKVGPDFIDPKWHQFSCGSLSYNLDLFSMGERRLKALFYEKTKHSNVAIVEGVMGLFDGKYSSFNIAKLLKIPVVLVVDAFGISESIKYLVKGFSEKIKKANLTFSIFLNRVSSERHLLRLEKALKGYNILGILFRNKDLELPSRHLGLYLPEDFTKAEEVLEKLVADLEKTVNFSLLKEYKIENFEALPRETFLPPIPYKTIAIAYDNAFNFYYNHLLEELKERARVLYFSPLKNEEIPPEAEAVFIGGGYPELWADDLSDNKKTLKSIKNWVEEGLPLYAECGGLIYLSKELFFGEKIYKFSQIFPFSIKKEKLTLGYRIVKPLQEIPFFETKAPFLAHEFHYTNLTYTLEAERFKKIRRIFQVKPFEGNKFSKSFKEGFLYKRCLATYMHLLSFYNV
ncbi:MAG: cobyrinate a,c-diamide synthase [Caldimicrobium sp.]